jgi:iron complex outermembrane receptor protein
MLKSSRTIYLRSSALAATLAAAMAASLLATSAQAQARTYHFELPQQSLSQSLRDYGRAAGRQIIFTEDVVGGLKAKALTGDLTADQAIDRLLDGTGLQAERTPAGALMIRREAAAGDSGAEADDATMLQEVVVTANKREERLHDVALSVTAVSGDSLQRRQELNVADLSAQVPGFAVQRLSPSYNRLIVRGQNSGGPGATVAVVVDDVPFTFSGSTANGAITVADLNPYDLARVEVLRGPQGTLYGAGAEGGILKYVTNQPSTGGFDGAAEVGVQSVAHGEVGYSAKGWVNLPLGDKAAIRANATYEDMPGYIDNPLRGEEDTNSGYRYTGRLALLLKPTEDLTLRAATFVQKLRTEGSYSAAAVGAITPATAPANETALTDGLSYPSYLTQLQNTSLSYSYVSADWNLGWATLSSVTSYGIMKFLLSGDSTGSPVVPGVSYGDYLGALVYGQPIVVESGNYNGLKKYNQEFRLASPEGFEVGGLPVEWQGGLFLTREVSTFKQAIRAFARSDMSTELVPLLGSLSAPSAYNEVSGFGEFTVHFTPQFDVSLGGRVSKVKQHAQVSYGVGLLTSPVPLTLPETKSDQSSTTFSFAPRYHFNDDTMVYGRIASGFRPGGPQLLIPGAPADFPDAYTSDSTVNYEVGFRTYLLDRKLSIDLAAYYIDWQDIQILTRFVSETSGQAFTVTGNAGSAISKGLEWNVSLRPTKGLTLQWLGGWVDAHLTKSAPSLGAFDGDKLSNVPDITSTVNADYEWPLFDAWRAYVGATWTHTGDQYTQFSASPTLTSHKALPDYDTFALRAGVSNDRWSLDAFVRNLTDEDAITSYSNSGTIGNLGAVNVIQPRTIGLRLGVKY